MSNKKCCYLAGNIASLHYDDATNWRKELTAKLELAGYTVLDPMRDKEHLANTVVGFTHNSDNCTANAIFTRDVGDIDKCDIVFCYLTQHSIGTCWELGYAYANNKYIIVVTTEEFVEHPFLSQTSTYITTSYEDGVEYLLA
jgi:nucleoside 2-deoxyribosyltransferase